MITVGVDLAAEPANTAVAILAWQPSSCVVTDLFCPAEDADIIDAAKGATKVGIDAPLGWPVPFVEFLVQHQGGVVVPPDAGGEKAWRHHLATRLTDRVVHEDFGVVPMSVAADRIARPAMRAAALLSRLATDDVPLDRSGAGQVVEAYPAAALKQWGLPHRGYKGKDTVAVRRELLAALAAATPWLELGAVQGRCGESDHCLDAVIAGLVARAAALGLTHEPDGTQQELGRSEGWIAVPRQGSLERLVD
ncbi:MAG: DUF429 domain-containing protein [Frankiaceae bacterium]|nr:DUF429 domain-containing protein [Frankiaceae bacterium]MBV9870299.1 DUF429 domain-containing protein [Frankiaceae bacterium]